MERQAILDAVKENLVAVVDGVTVEQIDPKKMMVEYGASSLDVVDIVSNSMRQLKIKIPRAELSGIKNIDDLTDAFCRHAQ